MTGSEDKMRYVQCRKIKCKWGKKGEDIVNFQDLPTRSVHLVAGNEWVPNLLLHR